MSETRKVLVEFRDKEALGRAVSALGGSVIGEGSHAFYVGPGHNNPPVEGFGMSLPGWTYPVVLGNDGALHYDDYKGMWGNVADIERLGHEYTMQVAETQAQAMGYYSERISDALKVFFPNGAAVWVFSDGRIDCEGFNGVGCDDAAAAFAGALGRTATISHKTEFFQERATVHEGGE